MIYEAQGLPIPAAERGRLRPKRHIRSALGVERFRFPAMPAISGIGGHSPGHASSAVRASAVDVVDRSGKGVKPLPLLPIPSRKQRLSTAQIGTLPLNWIAGRNSTGRPWIPSTARGLARVSSQRREHPLAPLLSLRLSVNQAKNLASSKHSFVDDLLSIRTPTPHGNSEFLAKMQRVWTGASTARAHRLSLLVFVVLPLWKTPIPGAGKAVPLQQEWCVPKREWIAPPPPPASPAP